MNIPEWIKIAEKKKLERSKQGWKAVYGNLYLRICYIDKNGNKDIFSEFGLDEMEIPNIIKTISKIGDRNYYPIKQIFKAAIEDRKLYKGWSGIVVLLSSLDICINKRSEQYCNKKANYNKIEFSRYSYHLEKPLRITK